MNVQFTDNSKEVLEAMQQAAVRALEKCGLTAEGYAKKLCPVDTGNLRNSITHTVDEEEPAAYIGSNVEYASYVCLGTGKYYPGGRPTPWAYQDAKGEWHSDSEVKIDKLGYVILNGQKTKNFWNAKIYAPKQPLRLKIRNICGDETIFVL